MPFQDKFLAEYPVAVQITGRPEFLKYGIMRLVVANRIRCVFILANDRKVTDPRCRLAGELILAESRPEVHCRTDGFFCAIIEVVAIRAYLGF